MADETKVEAGHTKGPWGVLHDGRILGGPVGDDGLRVMVAHVAVGDEVGRANARLIAACPTMYEYVSRKAREGDECAADIVAAISKATAR